MDFIDKKCFSLKKRALCISYVFWTSQSSGNINVDICGLLYRVTEGFEKEIRRHVRPSKLFPEDNVSCDQKSFVRNRETGHELLS